MDEIKTTQIDNENALGLLEQSDSVAVGSGADLALPRSSASVTATKKISRTENSRVTGKRGDGSIYRPSWRDKKTGQIKEAPVWWIAYSVRGKLIRQSSHSVKETVARKLLRKRLAEVALGKPVGPDIENTTFDDMAVMIVNDYRANERRSLARLEDALGHLREFFSDYRAVEITGDTITAYVTYRQEQKAANSTINNELSALSRAFSLGIRSDSNQAVHREARTQ